MDTVVTLSGECSKEVIDEAFSLCSHYENIFSRTKEGSDIYRINNGEKVTVNEETIILLEKALYYSRISFGKFDITVCPVSSLYNFKDKIMPSKEKIEEALSLIGYENLLIENNEVTLKKGMIDLGGIAKGYITDKVVEFLKDKGVKNATVNMGGNVYCISEGEIRVGIKKPFEESIALYVQTTENSFVTSGIYERYIEKDGKIYHHILDPETGYGVENTLASVTVIGKSSTDCDALSTLLMLMGKDEGLKFIDNYDGFEAVFIEKDYTVTLSDGIKIEDNTVKYK